MSKPVKKKAKINELRRAVPYVSQSALSGIITWSKTHEFPDQGSRWSIQHARDSACHEVKTTYGPLVQPMYVDGEAMYVLHPWAALSHVCKISAWFASVIMAAAAAKPPTAANPWNLIVYHDEITPGAALAHRHSRKCQALYWTFLEMFDTLSDERAWFRGHFHASHSVENWGQIVGAYVTMFFDPSGLDMRTTGIQLGMPDGRTLHLFVTFGVSLADSLGLDLMYDLKGTGGLHCCARCLNVFNRLTSRKLHGNFVWHTESDHSKIQEHTTATLNAVLREVERCSTTMGQGAFKELQTRVGINYPSALPRRSATSRRASCGKTKGIGVFAKLPPIVQLKHRCASFSWAMGLMP